MAPTTQNTVGWILSVAARSRCPRCGEGRLFDGFLTFAKQCNVCGLDYSFADTADGPAFFAMMDEIGGLIWRFSKRFIGSRDEAAPHSPA